MCLSFVIDKGIVKYQTRLSKREYKDDEKKVIKNKFFYCFLILFYIREFSANVILNL